MADDQDLIVSGGAPAPSAIPDVYVIARRGPEVLLLLREATGYKDGQWGPPSGKVELGETYAEAASRELNEEGGVSISSELFRFVHVVERIPDSGPRWIGLFFEVHVEDATPFNAEPTKHAALSFFEPDRLPDNTIEYFHAVLSACSNGSRYSAWRYLAAEDTGTTP